MSTPVRDITKGITAHFRYRDGKDRYVYEVVEEIKRAFKKLQAMLDKPTLGGGVPGSPGTDGQAGGSGGGGADSVHIFDGTFPAKIGNGLVDTRILRVKAGAKERFLIHDFVDGHMADIGTAPADLYLDDLTRLTTTPRAAIYRGFRESGKTTIYLSGGGTTIGPGPNMIDNGSFAGATVNSRDYTGQPYNWPMKDNIALELGTGPNGENVIRQAVGSGGTGQTAFRLISANYILGGSPSGGIYGCDADAGGPGLPQGSLLQIQLEKNKTYTMTFEMKLTGSSNRHFPLALYAHDAQSRHGDCGGHERYGLSDDSVDGATSFTASNWVHNPSGANVRFREVPADDTWRLYTITIDTTGVGSGVPDPFWFGIELPGNALSTNENFRFTNFSFVDPDTETGVPTVVHAPVRVRGFANDEWVISPVVVGTGNILTIAEATGIFSKPIMTPEIAAGATGGVVDSYGARFGFGYDGSLVQGSESFTDVASIFAEEPEFGTDPQAIITAGVISLRSGKALRFYGTPGGKYTSLRAQNQGANIDLQLPLDPPATEGALLSAHTSGVLYWQDSSGISGGGGVPTSRSINTTSPITGGGDLSADRTIAFDQTVDLNNNARVGVRKNSGGSTFLRRRVNLIEGSNVTLTVSDDSGNEEVDVTIASSGSGGSGYPPQLGYAGI